MKLENVNTANDVKKYIEGCINDFECGISKKSDTVVYLAELVLRLLKKTNV